MCLALVGYTVLSVAYPLTEVNASTAGGSEQILIAMDRLLTESGHQSYVVAAKGSAVSGQILEAPAAPEHLDDKVRQVAQSEHRELITRALQQLPIDLIHFHSYDFHSYLPDTTVPILATLHLPPDWYPESVFSSIAERVHLNCVSHSQRLKCPKTPAELPVIPNGIDIDKFAVAPQKDHYVLALGRICPEKGLHFALDAAKKAGVPLLLAGQVFPYPDHEAYFANEIAPRLDAERRFIGPADLFRKTDLLARARCVLIPSTVAETSSLVAMEAAASGTPVIAFRSGALPEVVQHEQTGFIVNDVDEMAEAIGRVEEIDSRFCRRHAEERFSATTMFDRYLCLYQGLLQGDAYGRDRSYDQTRNVPSSPTLLHRTLPPQSPPSPVNAAHRLAGGSAGAGESRNAATPQAPVSSE